MFSACMFPNIPCFLFTWIHFFLVVLEHDSFTFFWDVMCGPHESKEIAAMLAFLNLIEFIFCRIFRASKWGEQRQNIL